MMTETPPFVGRFGPGTLARLREIRAQQAALQREAEQVVAIVLDTWGHELPVASVEWDVGGAKNHWQVTPPAETEP